MGAGAIVRSSVASLSQCYQLKYELPKNIRYRPGYGLSLAPGEFYSLVERINVAALSVILFKSGNWRVLNNLPVTAITGPKGYPVIAYP
jgi:hypothetical protein